MEMLEARFQENVNGTRLGKNWGLGDVGQSMTFTNLTFALNVLFFLILFHQL